MIYPGRVVSHTNELSGEIKIDKIEDLSEDELDIYIEIKIQFKKKATDRYGDSPVIAVHNFIVDRNTGQVKRKGPITMYKKSGIGGGDFIFVSSTAIPGLNIKVQLFIATMILNVTFDLKENPDVNLDEYTINFDYVVDSNTLNIISNK